MATIQSGAGFNESALTKSSNPAVLPTLLVTLSDGEGALNPVGRINAGYVAIGQSAKVFTGTQALAGGPITIPLITVAAGKIFFITDIYVGSNTATVFPVTINAAGVAIFNGFSKGDTGPIVLPGIETQPQASAGQVVNLVLGAAAATTAAYMITGIEQ